MSQRLIGHARAYWPDIDGWLTASSGIDAMALPLDRFLNLVWHWMTRNGDEQSIERLRIRLWVPPVNVIPTTGPWSAEAETAAFQSLQARVAGATAS